MLFFWAFLYIWNTTIFRKKVNRGNPSYANYIIKEIQIYC